MWVTFRIKCVRSMHFGRIKGAGTTKRHRVFAVVLTVVVASLASVAPQAFGVGTDSGHQIDIGGRRLYLVCGGRLSPRRPTVVLVHGYHDSSDPWTAVALLARHFLHQREVARAAASATRIGSTGRVSRLHLPAFSRPSMWHFSLAIRLAAAGRISLNDHSAPVSKSASGEPTPYLVAIRPSVESLGTV